MVLYMKTLATDREPGKPSIKAQDSLWLVSSPRFPGARTPLGMPRPVMAGDRESGARTSGLLSERGISVSSNVEQVITLFSGGHY